MRFFGNVISLAPSIGTANAYVRGEGFISFFKIGIDSLGIIKYKENPSSRYPEYVIPDVSGEDCAFILMIKNDKVVDVRENPNFTGDFYYDEQEISFDALSNEILNLRKIYENEGLLNILASKITFERMGEEEIIRNEFSRTPGVKKIAEWTYQVLREGEKDKILKLTLIKWLVGYFSEKEIIEIMEKMSKGEDIYYLLLTKALENKNIDLFLSLLKEANIVKGKEDFLKSTVFALDFSGLNTLITKTTTTEFEVLVRGQFDKSLEQSTNGQSFSALQTLINTLTRAKMLTDKRLDAMLVYCETNQSFKDLSSVLRELKETDMLTENLLDRMLTYCAPDQSFDGLRYVLRDLKGTNLLTENLLDRMLTYCAPDQFFYGLRYVLGELMGTNLLTKNLLAILLEKCLYKKSFGVLSVVLKELIETNLLTENLLITLIEKCAPEQFFNELSDVLRETNLVTENLFPTLLAQCASNQSFVELSYVLGAMRKNDLLTKNWFDKMLDKCASNQSFSGVSFVLKALKGTNLLTENLLITLIEKCGPNQSGDEFRSVLEALRENNLLTENLLDRMLRYCTINQTFEHLSLVLEKLKGSNLLTENLFDTLVEKSAYNQSFVGLYQVLRELEGSNLLTENLLATLIEKCGYNQTFEHLSLVLEELKKTKLLTENLLTTLIEECTLNQTFEHLSFVLEELKGTNLLTESLLNIMVDKCEPNQKFSSFVDLANVLGRVELKKQSIEKILGKCNPEQFFTSCKIEDLTRMRAFIGEELFNNLISKRGEQKPINNVLQQQQFFQLIHSPSVSLPSLPITQKILPRRVAPLPSPPLPALPPLMPSTQTLMPRPIVLKFALRDAVPGGVIALMRGPWRRLDHFVRVLRGESPAIAIENIHKKIKQIIERASREATARVQTMSRLSAVAEGKDFKVVEVREEELRQLGVQDVSELFSMKIDGQKYIFVTSKMKKTLEFMLNILGKEKYNEFTGQTVGHEELEMLGHTHKHALLNAGEMQRLFVQNFESLQSLIEITPENYDPIDAKKLLGKAQKILSQMKKSDVREEEILENLPRLREAMAEYIAENENIREIKIDLGKVGKFGNLKKLLGKMNLLENGNLAKNTRVILYGTLSGIDEKIFVKELKEVNQNRGFASEIMLLVSPNTARTHDEQRFFTETMTGKVMNWQGFLSENQVKKLENLTTSTSKKEMVRKLNETRELSGKVLEIFAMEGEIATSEELLRETSEISQGKVEVKETKMGENLEIVVETKNIPENAEPEIVKKEIVRAPMISVEMGRKITLELMNARVKSFVKNFVIKSKNQRKELNLKQFEAMSSAA